MSARLEGTQTKDSPRLPDGHEELSLHLTALLGELVRTAEVPVGEAWSPALQAGEELGRFRLLRELGRGGFGVVFEAEDRELGRKVALKVVRPGSRMAAHGLEWLQREAEAVARLNHPNIVTIHDFGQGPAGPYLVLELLTGTSLAGKVAAGPLPVGEALDVAVDVSRALVHAHGAGVVHRDLKPGNVHLGEDGAAKVLDFGFAHLFGRGGVGDGGTPSYMAPEQWEGDGGDARVDLFALGVMLHQCLSGELPYRVDRDWSEAQEPGPTPALPRSAAPPRLRRLVRRLLDRDPAARPASAREVRDELLEIRREYQGRGRRRIFAAVSAVAVIAVGVAGWLVMGREPPPGEQVRVVLGAMENGSGEAALDAVPGLLATALEPSRRVRLVRKEKLALLSREAGLGEPGRLDLERGRTLARLAGAPVLLMPVAHAEGGALSLSLRVAAVEAETGRRLFEAESALKGPAELAAAVDRLSDRIRRELKERGEDRSLRRPVAEAVTSNPEAARRYYEGIDCLERRRAGPSASETCAPLFERALAQDPSFGLAQYQLAVIRSVGGAAPDQYRPYLDAALQAVDRLPAREAALVRALTARLEGKFAEAHRLYDEVLSASPEDVPTLQAAADLEISRGEWRGALGYLEKLVALAPGQEEPLESLIEGLGRLGRRDDLRTLLRRLESSADPFDRSRAIVQGHIWLGEQQAALDFARRAEAQRGDAGLPTLRVALSAAGKFEELVGVAEREVMATGDPWLRNHAAVALAAQGRVREALQINGEVARQAVAEEAAWRFKQRVFLLTVRWDARVLLRDAARSNATLPELNAQIALVLALLGDLQHATMPARSLPPGSPEQLEYAALVDWRSGDVDGALAQLDAIEARDAWPVSGLPPAYLIAEVSAASGLDSETLAALERFRNLPPRGFWRAFAYPRSLFLAAQAHARLGEREAARRDIDALLTLWKRADPDLSLLRQARALRAGL